MLVYDIIFIKLIKAFDKSVRKLIFASKCLNKYGPGVNAKN